jgi:GNAT superfamily N-acetyltransferase
MTKLAFHALTPDRWADVETLFGPRGACGGCWCMFWKLPAAEFAKRKGEGNRRAFRKVVLAGRAPGILAYDCGKPVGWCAVEPREAYPRLARSRILAPVDERPVWSVTCFFVARSHRRKGITVQLLRAAVKHVRRLGGRIVEGYPVVPKAYHASSTAFAWTGFAPAFEAAGFKDCVARSRPIMRRRA